MPRRKSPRKLQEICVSVAGDLLRKVNEKRPTEEMIYPSGRQSPFLCCPATMIQDIINYLGQSAKNNDKTIHKHVLQLLLCRCLENLDLTSIRINENELSHVLDLISPHSANLQSLQIFAEGFTTETREQFFELLTKANITPVLNNMAQNFNRITQLNLHNLCYDELLSVIGENCPELVILKAISENITDSGLIHLCTNGRKPAAEDFQLRCQKLQHISLDPRAEKITHIGILALLTHLPVLKNIEGCIMGCVLEEIYDTRDPSVYNKIEYKLTHYMYDWRRGKNDSIGAMKLALKTCPWITNLKLLEPTDEALTQLGGLTCLTSLIIISYTNQTSFEGGVLPLLQQAGKNLVKLCLSLNKVDLASIDWACPKLEVLDCSNVRQIYSQTEYSKNPFSNLRDLIFHANLRTTLNAETLKILLSSCVDLESLYVSYCNSLTDQTLDEILERNPLIKLQSLHLMYVERLTAVGIETLVLRESDLRKLWLFNVSGNHKATLRHVKEIVHQMNLELEIDLILTEDVSPPDDFGFSLEYYKVEKLSPVALVKKEFIEAFVKKGNMYLMSIDTKIDIHNCMVIYPTGELILHLDKNTYEELGLQGEAITSKTTQKLPQKYVVTIDLVADHFTAGKRNYDRVFERLTARKDLKFNCLIAWEPKDTKVCPSSIAAYFEIRAKLDVHLCNVSDKHKSKLSCPVPKLQPTELGNFQDVFDWIGFITNDTDSASVGSFVKEFLSEMPVSESQRVNCIQWRGFLTRNSLDTLFKNLRLSLSKKPLTWIVAVIHGFDDIPHVHSIAKSHNFHQSANNLLGFVLFSDGHSWKITPTNGNKLI